MQVVWFAKSKRLHVYWINGAPGHPGWLTIRLWRIEARFGRDRFVKWGRPPNPWAYENG
jgi:hypothetical protein